METLLEYGFTWVLVTSGNAAVLAVAVGLVCLLLGRWIPANWRHGLWLLVFIRAMVPVTDWEFRWALPTFREPEWKDSRPVTQAVYESFPREVVHAVARALGGSPPADDMMYHDMTKGGAAETLPPLLAGSESEGKAHASEAKPLSWLLIAAGLWLGGAVVWWLTLLAGWRRFRRNVLGTAQAAPEALLRLLDDARQLAGKTGRVRLRITSKLHTPAICHLWRPVILMPEEAVHGMSAEKVRLLLLHEIGHTQRGDVLIQVMTSLLLGLHWFNPLLWLVHRRLRAEAESATDAWVLTHTTEDEAKRYGETLIDLAARCSWMGWLFFMAPMVIGAAENTASLRSRIRAIGAYGRHARWTWIVGLACMAALMATGMTQPPKDAADNAPSVTFNADAKSGAPPSTQSTPESKPASAPSNAAATAQVSFRLKFTDSSGVPIEGVEARPVAYFVEERSGWHKIGTLESGLERTVLRSDAAGVVALKCPAKNDRGDTPRLMHMSISREGYVAKYDNQTRAKVNEETTIVLARTGTVQVEVLWNGKPVTDKSVRFETNWKSLRNSPVFAHTEGGRFESRQFRSGKGLIQAAWKTPEGEIVFSQTQSMNLSAGESAVGTLELTPGRPLKGKLDAAVPRPVKHARVGVCVTVENISDAGMRPGEMLSWQDWQEVREDGNFEFRSLPKGAVHVLVLADGWMSTSENAPFGTTVPPALQEPVTDEVVIPMVETATCEVTVVNAAGEPAPGYRVSVWPHLSWKNGEGGRLLDLNQPALEKSLKPGWKKPAEIWPTSNWRTYDGVTDAKGKVTVRNLPGSSQRVAVLVKGWKPGSPYESVAQAQYEAVEPGGVTKVRLEVP